MNTMPPRGLVAVLTVLVLAGCSAGAAATGPGPAPTAASITAPTTAATPPGKGAVAVSGTQMTLDGKPWTSHGVNLQTLVEPAAALRALGDPMKIAALDAYGLAELTAAAQFGADTVRFQISQPALDPQSHLYDETYRAQIVAAVGLARRAGFVVLLAMQDEAISGEPHPHPLPTQETVRDWDVLNQSFGSDGGVVVELYNEPHPPANAADWQLWAKGGAIKEGPAVGMATLVTHLRATGSHNVLVLDGLDDAKTLDGVPTVTDPDHDLVYAVHPYLDGSADESRWGPDFGTPARTYPVWADEWSAASGQRIGLGTLPSYQPATDLVNYVRARSIPLCAGAFDVPHFMVSDVPGWHYTTYDNYSPASTVDDAGRLVHALFATNYARPLTDADGR